MVVGDDDAALGEVHVAVDGELVRLFAGSSQAGPESERVEVLSVFGGDVAIGFDGRDGNVVGAFAFVGHDLCRVAWREVESQPVDEDAEFPAFCLGDDTVHSRDVDAVVRVVLCDASDQLRADD